MDVGRDPRPHPNDLDEVHAHLKRSGSLLSEEEREKLLLRIDADLAEIDERDGPAAS